MEKSINKNFDTCLREHFPMQEVDVKTYSPLALAYIGDCVFDLIVKSLVMNEGNQSVQKMHKRTSDLVQASSQSRMMRTLQPLLTEEEHAVYKRGRNTKAVSPAKNQSLTDYRRATGFEALMGFLYLEGRYDRMMELVKIGFNDVEEHA
jgi:ribonuclease-3 family protein